MLPRSFAWGADLLRMEGMAARTVEGGSWRYHLRESQTRCHFRLCAHNYHVDRLSVRGCCVRRRYPRAFPYSQCHDVVDILLVRIHKKYC